MKSAREIRVERLRAKLETCCPPCEKGEKCDTEEGDEDVVEDAPAFVDRLVEAIVGEPELPTRPDPFERSPTLARVLADLRAQR